MIDEVLVFLKEKLNDYFRLITELPEDKVAFADCSKPDAIVFPINNVVPVLVNVEEEKLLRPADRYEGFFKNGVHTAIKPPVSIQLSVLFVSRFSDYTQSIKFLSLVIKFFQQNPLFNRQNSPSLIQTIDRLRIELITTSTSQKNEIWSSLRSYYLPSVLYKISMLVFTDEQNIRLIGEISETDTLLSNISS